ncbi:MAG: mandelate racemase/muconate lactonizing enzyme family protein [bacterium]|jgi:L-alanine-DL-glutamate epimerase-like enolase superfamily enzyme
MIKNVSDRRNFLNILSFGTVTGTMFSADPADSAQFASPRQAGVSSRITSIEVSIHKREPNPSPIRDALQELPGIGSVEVKVTSEDGVSGTGDIYYGRITNALETLKAVIENELIPVAKGSSLSQIRKTWQDMVFETDYHGTTGLATLGIAAIDTALWDCLGKTLGVPCWQIWGGYHEKIPAYGMLGWINYDEKQLQERCERAIAQGYRAVKLKIGFPTLKEDIKRIQFVRDIIGDDIRLMLDANQVLTVGEAIMRGKAFEELGCYWFEEPIAAHDLEGYKRIADELTIQLATGENLYGPYDFARFIKHDAVDIIQPDLRRGGGPTALLEIGHMAHAFNIPYASHGGGAAHMNVMACIPNTIYVETGGTDHLIDGMLRIPQGPGFSWE